MTPDTLTAAALPNHSEAKSVELTLTVIGTADGEWRADLKQGIACLARNLAVVSRAAKELHADLSTPIDEVIAEARSQQTAKVADGP